MGMTPRGQGLKWFLAILCGIYLASGTVVCGEFTLGLEEVASGLQRPVLVTHAGDGRLFIVGQNGFVFIHDGTEVLTTPFLNITSDVMCCGEQGFLGLSFDLDYASNGFFYVSYTNTDGASIIESYEVSANDPNVADTSSGFIIFGPLNQPSPNHNGGHLAFGPDGYLYFVLGDGGPGGNPDNQAQNTGTLLGSILRIEVDDPSPYAIT